MIVAAVGLPGSGKTEVAKFFITKGFSRVYFGDVTFDYIKEHNIPINEQNEQEVRERFRKEHGMAAYAILNYPKIKKLVDSGCDVLIESMYSWEEYLFLREKFGDELFKVVATYASQKTRAERMKNRKERPLSRDDLMSRDHAQIENLHQAGPIALADYTIVNESGIDYLHSGLERIYELIMG
jgi:dephospho-CoA kinase